MRIAAATAGPVEWTDVALTVISAAPPDRRDTANPVRAQAALRHLIAWKRKIARPCNKKARGHLAHSARIVQARIPQATIAPAAIVLTRIVLTSGTIAARIVALRIAHKIGISIAARFAPKAEISPPIPIALRAPAAPQVLKAPAIRTHPNPSKNHSARIAIENPAAIPAAVPGDVLAEIQVEIQAEARNRHIKFSSPLCSQPAYP